jgi:hypothetical protein
MFLGPLRAGYIVDLRRHDVLGFLLIAPAGEFLKRRVIVSTTDHGHNRGDSSHDRHNNGRRTDRHDDSSHDRASIDTGNNSHRRKSSSLPAQYRLQVFSGLAIPC